MEISVRELKSRLSAYLRRVAEGEPRLPKYVLRLKAGEKTLAEIVSEERG